MRLGAAQFVDANDQRAKVLEGANRSQIHEGKTHGHQGNKDERNLQIGVRHHGITVLFQIESLGVVKARVVAHAKTLSRIAAEEPPDVPLKMWLVSAGIFRSA